MFWLTSVLSEQDILGLEVSMDHLIAVQEHQASDDVQRHQVTLTATTHNTPDIRGRYCKWR